MWWLALVPLALLLAYLGLALRDFLRDIWTHEPTHMVYHPQ